MDDTRQISQERFLDMVKGREVDDITIVNGQTVEVRLNPDALTSRPYKGLFDTEDPLLKGKPHVRLTVVSERAFRDDLAKMNPDFPIKTEERSLFDFLSR